MNRQRNRAHRLNVLLLAITGLAVWMTATMVKSLSTVAASSKTAARGLTLNLSAPHAPLPSGLVSWWPADGDANDAQGGNNGSLQSGAGFAPGKCGLAFSHSGGYVEVADSPSLSITGPLTLAAWINTNTNSVQQAIIEKYDVPGRNGYFLRLNGAGRIEASVCNPSTAGTPVSGGTTIGTGTWHHIAFVYDGSSIKVYLDGTLDGSASTSFTPTDGTTSLKIGARGDDAGTRFSGLIDDARIFNSALTQTDIQAVADECVGGSVNRKIAFDSNRTGDFEIFTMNPDGSSQTNVTNSLGDDTYPKFSPDGSKIVFQSKRALPNSDDIYVMNTDGTSVVRLTNNTFNDQYPSWSRDGAKIVFASDRDGNSEIYSMNADGTNQTRLTNSPGFDFAPAYSPDGSKIIFASDLGGHDDVYLMDANGANVVRLTNDANLYQFPSWSPDGAKIAMTGITGGNYDVWTMNADGGNKTRLTTGSAVDNVPMWSPDGAKIVFHSSRDGNFEIYTMNADGSAQTRLTTDAAQDSHPSWGGLLQGPPCVRSTQILAVPGTANPWLAGMPTGSTDAGTDSSPAQSPALVSGVPVTGVLTFSASGVTGYCSGCLSSSPDGGPAMASHVASAVNGIGQVVAPANALIGVFLDDNVPNLTPAPGLYLDFSTPVSRDYQSITPTLKQPFFIGDGLTSTGVVQQIVTPAGATRLFLGSMDGIEWNNNVGSFTVTVGYCVSDNTPPTVTCPAPYSASANNNCQAPVPDVIGGVTATDDSPGSVTLSQSPAAGTLAGLGATTITVTATDAANNTSTCSTTFTVMDNTPPTINCPANIITNTAAGTCSAVVSYTVTASDLCSSAIVVSNPPSGSTFPKGVTTVNVTASDAAGNTSTCTFTVTVRDQEPPSIACPSTILTLTDPGQCSAVVSFAPVVTDNCPGGSYVCSPPSGAPFPIGATTVNCTATDASGNTAGCGFTVTVNNSTPAASISGPSSGAIYAVGATVSFAGSFSDNVGDIHSGQWSFVSNTQNITQAGSINESTGAVSTSYSFTTAGVYLVTLTVSDQCGHTGTANVITPDGLIAMVVIYDPSGGFVTGGGWIDSPAGAYAPNPALTGRASFGFVSKYERGATVPTGDTEFQFRVANFNFHSTVYEWLVVAGARAQYRGSGTVNGAGDYRFILTAIDGQVSGGGGADKFRIKIWNNAGGGIVYDNQMNAPDSSNPTTVLGGGSIVIHN